MPPVDGRAKRVPRVLVGRASGERNCSCSLPILQRSLKKWRDHSGRDRSASGSSISRSSCSSGPAITGQLPAAAPHRPLADQPRAGLPDRRQGRGVGRAGEGLRSGEGALHRAHRGRFQDRRDRAQPQHRHPGLRAARVDRRALLGHAVLRAARQGGRARLRVARAGAGEERARRRGEVRDAPAPAPRGARPPRRPPGAVHDALRGRPRGVAACAPA